MRLNKRLPEELLSAVERSAPWTSVRGLHPNWRVARYRNGETFPAHQDQADSVIAKHPERVRQRYTSSHTLLINLKRKGEDFKGGATRFFMDGTLLKFFNPHFDAFPLLQEPTLAGLWTFVCHKALHQCSNREVSFTRACRSLEMVSSTLPRLDCSEENLTEVSSRVQLLSSNMLLDFTETRLATIKP